MLRRFSVIALLWIISCGVVGCAIPRSQAYQEMYCHLNHIPKVPKASFSNGYFLILLVDARHLDYSDNSSFLKTMAKHPSDGSKNSDVGHAWIYLQGIYEHGIVCFEGGHSGECGRIQTKYFDGVMNYIDFGYANPTAEDLQNPRFEPNPIKYLWETQDDGFCQLGNGGHRPTFAVKVDLNTEQFQRILSFTKNYCYEEYALTGNQCSSFVAQIAALAGVDLECETTISIEPCLWIAEEKVQLWNDPCYSELTFASPDVLEKSLMEAVREGKAENALEWYCHYHPSPLKKRLERIVDNIARFPRRYWRYLCLSWAHKRDISDSRDSRD